TSNIEAYLRRIKEVCRRRDPNCKVIVFGSYVRETMRADSDIDVLLVTDTASEALNRGRLKAEIAREIGLVTPFEIHGVTWGEYEGWYRGFIDVYLEI
ncbi:MAG: nucleotidyltransferase domain-containing protein, partial [Acidilobaceae archaeon]